MTLFTIGNPTLGIFVPLALYLVLRLSPAIDPSIVIPVQHFYIVSATSIVSTVIGVAMGIAGSRQRNLQIVFVALAFISLAGLFSVHGLATPGFLLPPTRLVGVAAQLSVFAMAFWLWLSSLPSDTALSKALAARANWLLGMWTIGLIGAGLISLRTPSIVDWVPVDQTPLRWVVALLTISLAAGASYRFWQSYRYSKFPFQISITYVGGWIAISQIIISSSETFRLSWWIYHFLLLFAVLVSVLGLIVQYSRGESLVMSVKGLFANDPAERLEAGISPSIRALIAATEARDPYTAGHSYRVAQSALRLGERLKLSPEELRVLAQAGVVHDVGKLQIPDSILNKPSELTAEERKIIQKHPLIGYELCARLGFMPPELEVIRSHHERPDGEGYPDRLSGEQIPKLVRVVSVVDVYDALTSARSYRAAWMHEDAVAYLKEMRGSQFDAEVVDAWLELVRGAE